MFIFAFSRNSPSTQKMLAPMYKNGDKFENVEICFSQNLVNSFFRKTFRFIPRGDVQIIVHVAGRGRMGDMSRFWVRNRPP
jgi:hypothetical protein